MVAGDTLWKLVKHNYGDDRDGRPANMMALVAAANHIVDPNRLRVGQIIYFPSVD